MLQNPGRPVTIYEIARFIGHAYPRSMTPQNISTAFAKCGIFPYNKDIFSDEDLMPSSVTDRPVVSQKSPDAETSANLDKNNQQPHSTLLETRRSSFYRAITPHREIPSILSEENHSYYHNVTPTKQPDEECKDENHKSKEHIITPLKFRPLLKTKVVPINGKVENWVKA
ncbi:unnamed protein product [Parnassius mnemosyne]|uniref:Uncharacterized protein n=1 Tax=Parnassius mnemosyne TaxID=213953 RepID=A0AAV1KWL5_9NEOP